MGMYQSVCHSGAQRLEKSKGNSPVNRIPDDYYPEGSENWYVLPEGKDQGKKLFFYDFTIGQDRSASPEASDSADALPVIVFVHGNPESSYTYSQVRDQLMAHAQGPARIIAMDHIGFGLSDQASFEMVEMHHAANLSMLVKHLDLQNITLVIHDWGGAIGIGAFIDQSERVKSLVLMNTTVFPIPLQGLNYTRFPFRYLNWNSFGYRIPWRLWKHIPPLVMYSTVGKWAFIKRSANFFWRSLRGQLSEGEVLYRDMFSTRMNALSSKRNVKQTKVWGHGYRYQDATHGLQDNRAFYKHIQKQLPLKWGGEGANIPCRAFFGEWDPAARIEVQEQWIEALPQLEGQIQTFPDAGHFVEEHKFVEIAEGILEVAGLKPSP